MILHLVSAFPPLSETFVLREIRRLRADGWNIVIAPLRPLHKTPRAQGFEDLESCAIPVQWVSVDLLVGFLFILVSRPRQCWRCMRIISASLGRPVRFVKMLYTLMSVMRIAWRMRKASIELVRAHFLHTEALAARFIGMLLDIPYSVTVYTVFVELPGRVIHDIVSHAVFLVADTHQTEGFLKSFGVEPDRIHVVHNSVNIEEFPLRSSEKATGHPILLGVGRLDPKKGFDVLISACSILRERGVDFRCVIVGDGGEREKLLTMRASCRLEDHLELIGNLSFAEVKRWYYKATVFAMPSVVTSEGQTDGLPTVVIEAMASGLPIVGSLVAGIPEAVREGINGFLVPANEPEQLANRLQLLLEEEEVRLRFGRESRRIAEARFDLKRKTEKLSQIFNQHLGLATLSVSGFVEADLSGIPTAVKSD
jgi:glycosyltransferase involved in cell wall biosynthesis